MEGKEIIVKCKICGGELKHIDGQYICQSCGNKFSVENVFENNEVYICYVETDESGRRTIDSGIAQDIYENLENKKIHAFYKRVSISDLFGEEAEKADNYALDNSKVILVIGTSQERYQMLCDKYGDAWNGRVVIPVYSGMNASSIPKGINSIQALNYEKVGAKTDLINGVLSALGREKETDFNELARRNNRKKILFTIIVIVLVIIAGIFAIFILGKKNTEVMEEVPIETEENVEPDEQSIYEEATQYIDAEEFSDAIIALSGILEYKDSAILQKTLYSKYAGYYHDTETEIDVHIQTYDENKATIEINAYSEEGDLIKTTENAVFNANILQYAYTDSENNQGTIIVTLNNSSVQVNIKNEEMNSDIFIPDCTLTFNLTDKSDEPYKEELSIASLIKYLNKNTTLNDLERKGWELEYVSPLYRDDDQSVYQIKDTDILVVMSEYTLAMEDGYWDLDVHMEKPIMAAIIMPVKTLDENLIGKEALPYVEDDVYYFPNGAFYDVIGSFYYKENLGYNITEDTSILMFGKSIGDKDAYEAYAKQCVDEATECVEKDAETNKVKDLALKAFYDQYGTNDKKAWVSIEYDSEKDLYAEGEPFYLVYVGWYEDDGITMGYSQVGMYNIYPSDYRVEPVVEGYFEDDYNE